MTRVLVVEDEERMRRALGVNLRARGYDVDLVGSGEEGLDHAAAGRPDLVLLDLGLPGIDGTEVVRRLRGWSAVPIIVLSARDTETDKVVALDAGADDYVTKPFGINELLARLRSVLRRRPTGGEPDVVRTADFTLDFSASRAWRGDTEVHLTPTEWQLATHLVRNPGRLLTQRWLLRAIWGPEREDETGYLRVYLTQLRRKLEPETGRPRYFLTEPGLGYRFDPDGRSEAVT